jgi:hypothetical protein
MVWPNIWPGTSTGVHGYRPDPRYRVSIDKALQVAGAAMEIAIADELPPGP